MDDQAAGIAVSQTFAKREASLSATRAYVQKRNTAERKGRKTWSTLPACCKGGQGIPHERQPD